MPASITTRVKHYGSIADRLEALVSARTQRQIAAAVGREAVTLVKGQFVYERDPYGLPWEPVQHKSRRKILTGATRTLKRRISARTVGRHKVRVSASTPYASFHQHGTKHLPQRLIFPDNAGIPAKWRRVFGKAATKVMRKAVK